LKQTPSKPRETSKPKEPLKQIEPPKPTVKQIEVEIESSSETSSIS